MTPFQIYLISQADSFKESIQLICYFSGIIAVALGIGVFMFTEDYMKDLNDILKKYLKFSVISFLIVGILAVFAPSTKTLVAMYTLPSIVNNKEAEKLPLNLVNFANSWLEENTKKEKTK